MITNICRQRLQTSSNKYGANVKGLRILAIPALPPCPKVKQIRNGALARTESAESLLREVLKVGLCAVPGGIVYNLQLGIVRAWAKSQHPRHLVDEPPNMTAILATFCDSQGAKVLTRSRGWISLGIMLQVVLPFLEDHLHPTLICPLTCCKARGSKNILTETTSHQ